MLTRFASESSEHGPGEQGADEARTGDHFGALGLYSIPCTFTEYFGDSLVHRDARTAGGGRGLRRTESTMQWDVISNHARADLVVQTDRGEEDVFLWEHSSRVARYASQIVSLPTVRSAAPDEIAVMAAALYHEAGWIARLKRGDVLRSDILVHSVLEDHWEEGAAMLERSLVEVVPADSLARASHAIRVSAARDSDCIEAQILTDADHLDEFGIISLWSTVRRGHIDGKGVQAALETWRRRKEYRFWDARLKDSFHFAPVRAVARRRLALLDEVMQELDRQHQAADLDVGFET